VEGKEEQVCFSYSSVGFVKVRSVSRSKTNMAELHFEERKKNNCLEDENKMKVVKDTMEVVKKKKKSPLW